MLRPFLTLLLLAICSSCGWACSCFPMTFDDRYCLATTTLKGTVLAKTDNCPGTCDPVNNQVEGMITYIVKVDQVLQGEEPEDGILYLKTALNSALCGVTLTTGQSYLFNLDGMKVDIAGCPRNYWNIGLCSFPKAWDSLTADELGFLQKAVSGVGSCNGEVVEEDTIESDEVTTPTGDPQIEDLAAANLLPRTEENSTEASVEPLDEDTFAASGEVEAV